MHALQPGLVVASRGQKLEQIVSHKMAKKGLSRKRMRGRGLEIDGVDLLPDDSANSHAPGAVMADADVGEGAADIVNDPVVPDLTPIASGQPQQMPGGRQIPKTFGLAALASYAHGPTLGLKLGDNKGSPLGTAPKGSPRPRAVVAAETKVSEDECLRDLEGLPGVINDPVMHTRTLSRLQILAGHVLKRTEVLRIMF